VLQINSVCGIGSTGRIATDIHNILIQQGHESYIAYGRNLPKNCETAIRIGNKFDNYSHVIATRLFDEHGFGSKKATMKFLERIYELDPNIIHLHNIHGYYINIEILFDFLRSFDKPIFWTLHDCWPFTGHCTYFDNINCNKWVSNCCKCPQKHEYPKSIIVDNSNANYYKKKRLFTGIKNLTIITPSKWLASLVNRSFLSEYPIEVIHNGIDLNIFKPRVSNFREKYGLINKYIILGVASVWGERKGFFHFVELAKMLNTNEVIVLVGLTKKQSKLLPKNIIGITRTNNAIELAEIYSAADVFINPTLEDNFPTVNIEALACGTPVLTYETGGSPESIDTTCGKVIKDKNPQSIVQAIREIKQMGDLKSACIRRAMQFSSHERYNEYIKLYLNKCK